MFFSKMIISDSETLVSDLETAISSPKMLIVAFETFVSGSQTAVSGPEMVVSSFGGHQLNIVVGYYTNIVWRSSSGLRFHMTI